jgi:molybdate transport system substrate-binding protein
MSATAPARRRRSLTAGAAGVAVAVASLVLAGCGSSGPTGSGPTSSTVTVLAAASLTESFDRLKTDFERANPGVTVETSYGSSATLVQQVNNGAPAQVIALAGTAAAEPLDKSLVKDTQDFAPNVLEIAVPPGNPAGIASISDLAEPTVTVVLCADTAPCGKAAQTTLKKAGITANVVSKEVDVKATLAKVKLGEADAAIVYHSDVVAAKDAVTGIQIAPDVNTSLSYPIITLSDDAATRAFVTYVLSAQGLATVQSFGLGAP